MSGPDDGGQLLRAGLLAGEVVVVAGPAVGGGRVGPAVASECEGLGATVLRCVADAGDELAVRDAVAGLVASHGGVQTLVVDAGALFAAAPEDGGDELTALRGCLDGAWNVVRAVANAAFIGGAEGAEPERDGEAAVGDAATGEAAGGKLVLIAPGADGGPHAEVVRAALENMARTLSIEWARYQIRPTAIAPGPDTVATEVAQLVAFLASPAGDYYSGCVFSLGGP